MVNIVCEEDFSYEKFGHLADKVVGWARQLDKIMGHGVSVKFFTRSDALDSSDIMHFASIKWHTLKIPEFVFLNNRVQGECGTPTDENVVRDLFLPVLAEYVVDERRRLELLERKVPGLARAVKKHLQV